MKFYYYVFIIMGIIITLNLAGYTTPSGGVVGTLILSGDTIEEGGLADIKDTGWYDLVIAAFLLAAGVGIVTGFLTRTPSVSYLVAAGLSLFTGLLIIDLIWIYGELFRIGEVWLIGVATAIFAPLTVGFIITAIEWWQGSD